MTQVSLPDGTSVQTSYQGIYTTVMDQAGKQRRQMVDALGRIVRVDEPDANNSLGSVDAPAQATSYDYDTLGNLIHITQGTGTNTQHRYFKYDALSRLTYERQVEQVAPAAFNLYDPLTGNSQWTRHLTYDETINGVAYKGLLTTQTDARLVTTQLAYDQLSRPITVTYSDGTPAVNNYYDTVRFTVPNEMRELHNLGRLTEVTTAESGIVPATSQATNYDLMGRVANQRQTVETTPYTTIYSYNLGGQMTSETYPSGRVVTSAYGDAARLTSVSSNGTTYASQLQFNAQGLLSSVQWGNGATESYQYNNRLQLTEQSLVKNSAVIQRYVYGYGQVNSTTGAVDTTKNNGQIGSIESYIGTAKQWQQRFTYDSLSRLSAASEYRGDNSQQTYLLNYDYDLFGNRYQKQASNTGNPAGVTQKWVEDADISQLTNRFTVSSIQYDAAGNVTRDEKFSTLKFLYDANNRQRQSANLDDSNVVTAIYDGAGQRVATKTSSSLSINVYDAFGKLVAEYGQATPSAGSRQYIFADQQGTPRVVLNTDGSSVLSRHDYQPFGEELAGSVGLRATTVGYSSSDGIKQKYAGMEADESGLSHTLWRQYESRSGRWTAPDPYNGSMTIADPQSFNRYSYVNNDPVNQTDPLGLMAGADQGIGGFEGWGGDPGFNDPHFGGPGIIENGMNGFNDRPQRMVTTRTRRFTVNKPGKKPGTIESEIRVVIVETTVQYTNTLGQVFPEGSTETTVTAQNTGNGAYPLTESTLRTVERVTKDIAEVSRNKKFDVTIALGIAAEETLLGGGGIDPANAGREEKKPENNPMQLSCSSGGCPSTDRRDNIARAIDLFNANLSQYKGNFAKAVAGYAAKNPGKDKEIRKQIDNVRNGSLTEGIVYEGSKYRTKGYKV